MLIHLAVFKQYLFCKFKIITSVSNKKRNLLMSFFVFICNTVSNSFEECSLLDNKVRILLSKSLAFTDDFAFFDWQTSQIPQSSISFSPK